MKQSHEYRLAQENMQAGKITAAGFLGIDTRPLADIIEADEERMTRLGLDFDLVCDRLASLLAEGSRGLGEPVTIEGKWLVRVDEARGTLPSPWADGIFHKVNCEVESLTGDGKLVFNELCIHLIRRHHFFQGKGSPFRLEPEVVKSVLRI